eukprot:3594866-Rhodomonas_salina.2
MDMIVHPFWASCSGRYLPGYQGTTGTRVWTDGDKALGIPSGLPFICSTKSPGGRTDSGSVICKLQRAVGTPCTKSLYKEVPFRTAFRIPDPSTRARCPRVPRVPGYLSRTPGMGMDPVWQSMHTWMMFLIGIPG